MAKSYVTVATGQCGLQVCNAVWELFSLEHGIFPDGNVHPSLADCPKYKTFFDLSHTGRRFARAVNCDTESTVMDEIRVGHYRSLFHPDSLINALDDGSNVYARGYYTTGKPVSKLVQHRVDKAVNDCDNFGGFVLVNSYGGGTGSGLGDLICTGLRQQYPKAPIIQFSVLPSAKLATSILEPYNSVFTTKTSVEQADVCVQITNEPCYEICADKLYIRSPNYSHINRLICQVYSSITASARFGNELYSDINQIQVNTVPYPKVHFPTPGFSPFETQDKLDYSDLTVGYIARETFAPENNLAGCDLQEGKFLAVSLQFRGPVSSYQMTRAVLSLKRDVKKKFVNWSPTGFKVGICHQPTLAQPGSYIGNCKFSCAGLFNHTNGMSAFDKVRQNFLRLFHSRAFVHWYVGEGMEEGEFEEAREAMIDVLKAYSDCNEEDEEKEEEQQQEQEEDSKRGNGSNSQVVEGVESYAIFNESFKSPLIPHAGWDAVISASDFEEEYQPDPKLSYPEYSETDSDPEQ